MTKAAAYSLSIALWRRRVVGLLDGFGDGSMVEEWGKLWRDQIGKMFSSLSASLSGFLPFPLSAIRLLPTEG